MTLTELKIDHPTYRLVECQQPDTAIIAELRKLRIEAWAHYLPEDLYDEIVQRVHSTIDDHADATAYHYLVYEQDQIVAASRINYYAGWEDHPFYPFAPVKELPALNGPLGYLSRLVVSPMHQKQGLAHLLDTTRVNKARAMFEYGGLAVEVADDRFNSLNKSGFGILGNYISMHQLNPKPTFLLFLRF